MEQQTPTHIDAAQPAHRITCHISAPPGEDMPRDDAHPFWRAVDDLGDAVAEALKEAGTDPNELLKTWSTDNGSHLTVSSDTPAYAAYFWVYLPKKPSANSVMLNIVLLHLARARRALPNADWKVALGDNALLWEGGTFLLPH